jgi:ATP-dependent Zn protease
LIGIAANAYICYKLYQMLTEKTHFKKRNKRGTDEDNQKFKTFSDIGGCEKAKDAIKEIIDFIRNPEFYE